MKNDYLLIKSIFEDFEVPVEFIRYIGKEKIYITYSFIDDRPGIVADDKEVLSIVNVDIDIFSDGNYLDLEDKVEAIMIQNNFIRVGSSPDMYEEDTGLYHKTIEYEKERIR